MQYDIELTSSVIPIPPMVGEESKTFALGYMGRLRFFTDSIGIFDTSLRFVQNDKLILLEPLMRGCFLIVCDACGLSLESGHDFGGKKS